jgi:HK97 family phage prohead protease
MRNAVQFHVKSLDEAGYFSGYASVFNVVDQQRDVVMPGAFAYALQTMKPGHVKLLWQHTWSEPIGVIERLFEDAQGLYIEGRLLLDIARAREAHALLKAGAMSGLSIGYSPVKTRIEPDTGVRQLLEVDLWEISLVTLPANPLATVTVVKSHYVSPEILALKHALNRAMRSLYL